MMVYSDIKCAGDSDSEQIKYTKYRILRRNTDLTEIKLCDVTVLTPSLYGHLRTLTSFRTDVHSSLSFAC
jgi:hypothetical protein